jgi:predicted metalloendopeptidase
LEEQRISEGKIEQPRFTTDYMDKSEDPRSSFYDYATGGWRRTHTIPNDKARWTSFHELYEWNMVQLNDIAKECTEDASAKPGTYARMVGDFYKSAMDTERVNRIGFAPIDDMWRRIEAITSASEIAALIPALHLHGVPAMFDATPDSDIKNSSVYTLYISQGGISLPDRDYYMKEQFAGVLAEYKSHIKKMFVLKGIDDKTATEWSGIVLGIESDMAKVSRPKAALRDAEKNYTRVETNGLESMYPDLSLLRYIESIGVPKVEYIVVMQPEFMEWLNSSLKAVQTESWKVYLRWKLLHSFAPLLHSAVDTENFRFFRKTLLGQKEQEPRWKRAVGSIDIAIGEALGKLYVDRHFPPENKVKAMEMINDLLEVFRGRLSKLEWMSQQTRQKALEKLSKFSVKIGYPDKFRDYAGLEIRPDDYAGNMARSFAFEAKRTLSRVGGPVDRTEWSMTPPTVNAYYNTQNNEIVFPAGIFQPSFFDASMDYAVNYGGLGAVIGHEMTHGFDDQGRKYDGMGNLGNWWSEEDARRFTAKTDLIVKEYSSKEVLPGLFINGELTLGENIADMGGVSIAYEALQRRLDRDPSGRKQIDGLTQEQRFFVAFGQIWREMVREEEQKRLLTIDPHSPGRYRATIPAKNEPAFDTAFPKKPGEKAGDAPRLGVW